jgi:deazaflavin-dependent oxidoreductase (nitroreductase family)
MGSRTRHRLETRFFRVAIERFGAQIDSTWILEVVGRRTGVARFTPVKLLEIDGERYLVSLWGHTDWSRNLRSVGMATLRHRGQALRMRAEEVPPPERPRVLRAYLAGATRATTVDLLGSGSREPDAAHLRRIAPDHPVFHLTPMEATMIDTSEMNVVHVVFRREFRNLPALVRAVPAGDTPRAAVVRRHVDFMFMFLTHHHEAEDAALWPAVSGRVPADLVLLMEDQHKRAHAAIEAVGPVLSRWCGTADPADREELAGLLDRLHTVLIEHLDAEEQRMLPVAAATLTQEQWEHFGRVAKTGPIAPVPLIIGMLRYETDPERFRVIMADMPAPIRAVLLPLARWAFRRCARRVYGTVTPPRLVEVAEV